MDSNRNNNSINSNKLLHIIYICHLIPNDSQWFTNKTLNTRDKNGDSFYLNELIYWILLLEFFWYDLRLYD